MFYTLVVHWMEADLKASFRSVISKVLKEFCLFFLRSDEHDVELPRGVSGLSVPRGHPRFDVGIPSGSNDPLW